MQVHSENSVLVYDVGGSHVAAALCRQHGYALEGVQSASHPEEETAAGFVRFLHALGMEALAGRGPVEGAELAMPGPFDYHAGISWMTHKLPYLHGLDLRGLLAASFGWEPEQVRFLNDAAAYLLGEIGAGEAKGAARAIGFTLGTGIGSAFAVDGSVVVEGPGVPPGGEIWNVPYKGGIVEDFVSTRAIQGLYRERTGLECDVAELAAKAGSDLVAAEVFTEFGRQMGLALRGTLAAFAPDVVVLGGGISRSAKLFLPSAREALGGLSLELRVSTLQDTAPLVGAGVAWFERPVAVPAMTSA